MSTPPDRLLVKLDGAVLDITNFVAIHPGGPAVFNAFNPAMSPKKKKQLKNGGSAEIRDISRVFHSMGHSANALQTAMSMRVDLDSLSKPAEEQEHVARSSFAEMDAANDAVKLRFDDDDEGHLGDRNNSDATRNDLVSQWLQAAQHWVEDFDRQLSARTATKDTRGYGARWHDQRRQQIQHAYPEKYQWLCQHACYFPPTAILGIVGAIVHYHVAFSVIPLLFDVLVLGGNGGMVTPGASRAESSSSSSATIPSTSNIAFSPSSTPSFFTSPSLVLAEVLAVNIGSGWTFGGFLAMIVATWLYAFTVGAVCKMISFGVSHEIVHETVHPYISILNLRLGEDEDGENSFVGRLRSRFPYVVRWLCKDLLLRVSTLPSIGTTIFEYYYNQHLSHHRYLGALDAGDGAAVAYGTQRADGDQLSIVNMMMSQRMTKMRWADASGGRSVKELGGVEAVEKVHEIIVNEDLDEEDSVFSGVSETMEKDGGGRVDAGDAHTKRNKVKVAAVTSSRRNSLASIIVAGDSPVPRRPPTSASSAFGSKHGKRAAMEYARRQASSATVFGEDNNAEGEEEKKKKVPVFRFIRSNFQSLNAIALVKHSTLSDTSVGVFLAQHPWFAKLLLDPPFHLLHFGMQIVISVLHMVVVPVYLVATLCGYLLGNGTGGGCYDFLAVRLLRGKVLPRTQSTLRAALRQAWPIASVGIQALISIYLLLGVTMSVTATSSTSSVAVVGAAQSDRSNFYCYLAFIVVYLSLSEMFVFGFAFHPFLAYFLTVHHSAYYGHDDDKRKEASGNTATHDGVVRNINTTSSASVGATPCQPTRSIYSWWFSWATMHLSHHTEHHDFPWVAWWYLPKLKTHVAPNFYRARDSKMMNMNQRRHETTTHLVVGVEAEEEECVEENQTAPIFACNASPFRVIWDYLQDDDTYVYACANCT